VTMLPLDATPPSEWLAALGDTQRRPCPWAGWCRGVEPRGVGEEPGAGPGAAARGGGASGRGARRTCLRFAVHNLRRAKLSPTAGSLGRAEGVPEPVEDEDDPAASLASAPRLKPLPLPLHVLLPGADDEGPAGGPLQVCQRGRTTAAAAGATKTTSPPVRQAEVPQ